MSTDDAAPALPERMARRCPFCGQDANATLRAAIWSGQKLAFVGPMGPVHDMLATGLYQCDACERASMLLFEEGSPAPELIGAWPRMRGHANEKLPADVDADRVEAWNCYFGAEHRAAVVMARSALTRALRFLHAAGATPADMTNDLAARGTIDRDLARRLENSELAGGGPPDELGPVDEARAKQCVEALDDFLAATIAPPAR